MDPNDTPARPARPGHATLAAPAPAPTAQAPIALGLTVWPHREGQEWRAELRLAGEPRPLSFDKPLDLVLFLTELPGRGHGAPRGLR